MRKPMLRVLVATALLASGSAALWAGIGTDIPVIGTKLLIKDKADPAKRRALYLSKDPSFSVAGINPTVGGARFALLAETGTPQSDVFVMPASGWREKKPGQFLYEDKAQVNGPVVQAKLKDGLVKVVATGPGMTYEILGTTVESVSAHVFLSDVAYICTIFPGVEGKVKKNDPEKGIFIAIKAEAPSESCSQILD